LSRTFLFRVGTAAVLTSEVSGATGILATIGVLVMAGGMAVALVTGTGLLVTGPVLTGIGPNADAVDGGTAAVTTLAVGITASYMPALQKRLAMSFPSGLELLYRLRPVNHKLTPICHLLQAETSPWHCTPFTTEFVHCAIANRCSGQN